MTETKALAEIETPKTLNLDETCNNFLNNPYKQVFMTQFNLGSNRLVFYGNPIVMSNLSTTGSELIKSSLSKFAGSKPPYELLSFDKVLERPMTLLWLYMNDCQEDIFFPNPQLDLTEFLHLYRLMNYFDVKVPNELAGLIIARFFKTPTEEGRDILKDEKNKDTLIRNINISLLHLGTYYNELFLTDEERVKYEEKMKTSDPNIFHYENVDIIQLVLMRIYNDFPEISADIDYIPVLVNNEYSTYAERKVLIDRNNFIKSNTRCDVDDTGRFTTIYFSKRRSNLTIETWGPNVIKFRYEGVQIGPISGPMTPVTPLHPILVE